MTNFIQLTSIVDNSPLFVNPRYVRAVMPTTFTRCPFAVDKKEQQCTAIVIDRDEDLLVMESPEEVIRLFKTGTSVETKGLDDGVPSEERKKLAELIRQAEIVEKERIAAAVNIITESSDDPIRVERQIAETGILPCRVCGRQPTFHNPNKSPNEFTYVCSSGNPSHFTKGSGESKEAARLLWNKTQLEHKEEVAAATTTYRSDKKRNKVRHRNDEAGFKHLVSKMIHFFNYGIGNERLFASTQGISVVDEGDSFKMTAPIDLKHFLGTEIRFDWRIREDDGALGILSVKTKNIPDFFCEFPGGGEFDQIARCLLIVILHQWMLEVNRIIVNSGEVSPYKSSSSSYEKFEDVLERLLEYAHEGVGEKEEVKDILRYFYDLEKERENRL